MKNLIDDFIQKVESLSLHGLFFQYVALCPTRTWAHYQRLCYFHLNKYMQAGLLLHELSYKNIDSPTGYGIQPDQLDWESYTLSEIKRSRSHEAASELQLLFYLAVMHYYTKKDWKGLLRYPSLHQTKTVLLDESGLARLSAAYDEIAAIVKQETPPPPVQRPVCCGCSFRMLCWQESTEDSDF